MKIVVVGGTGLIGSLLIPKLVGLGHEAISASPKTGINTVTGQGLAEAFEGAQVVVDVSNSPSFEDKAVMDFFTVSTTNIVRYGSAARVAHIVALSVVGTQSLSESSYFRAKMAQETLITGGSLPFSIVHATQFFEFMKPLADWSTQEGKVRLPPAFIQPMAANDVATAMGAIALRTPSNSVREVAGPNKVRLDGIIRQILEVTADPREVIADPDALYFGAHVEENTLVPGLNAELSSVSFDDWLNQSRPRNL